MKWNPVLKKEHSVSKWCHRWVKAVTQGGSVSFLPCSSILPSSGRQETQEMWRPPSTQRSKCSTTKWKDWAVWGGGFFCVCVIYFFRLESIFASVNDTRLHTLTFSSILQNAFQSQRSLWSPPGRDCPDGHHRTLFHGWQHYYGAGVVRCSRDNLTWTYFVRIFLLCFPEGSLQLQ